MSKEKATGIKLEGKLREWLETRPRVLERLEQMRRICANEEHEHDLLAKAEAGLVKELDETGRERRLCAADGGCSTTTARTRRPESQPDSKKHPRYHLHFTPTSASWLNQV